ncbi:MAG TPA: hypothetical protein VN667_15540 [Burkholderiales bacterium]|nr:hypothetical protein [Burkholderiales bacterium]
MAISPLEYARFLRAIGRDRRLPLSWQEWSVQARHADGFIVSMGGRVESVPVEYEGFMRYCADRGERPSYPALRAYALSLSAQGQGDQQGSPAEQVPGSSAPGRPASPGA